MKRKLLTSCMAMLLLSGMAIAADEEQPAPPQGSGRPAQSLPDALFPREIAPEQIQGGLIVPPETDRLRDSQPGGETWQRGQAYELLPIQLQKMIQDRMQGEYWLGIECYPVMPVLRAQLSLPENQGLVVSNVVPESPAAKAGIEANDILMLCGEKKLATVQDLSETIEAAKETPLKLDIIRAGKVQTVEATPAQRPQSMMFKPEGSSADWKEIEQWLRKMEGGAGAGQPQPLHLRVIQPGAILPPGAPVEPPMPGNLSINVNRNGDQPAQISVRWNDKKWDINEKELDKLPPEVRPHVERMLGHGKIEFAGPNGTITAEALDYRIAAPPPGTPGVQSPRLQIQPFRSLDDRLDELNRRIDQLQNELHEHWGERPSPAHAEKNVPHTEPQQSK